MAITDRGRCDYADCNKASHSKTGPCSMHYYRERRALDTRINGPAKSKRGGARDMKDKMDYEDFWLFVKKHVLWDGNGRPIGLKAGLNRDWRK
jgi:hypothetical protein